MYKAHKTDNILTCTYIPIQVDLLIFIFLITIKIIGYKNLIGVRGSDVVDTLLFYTYI